MTNDSLSGTWRCQYWYPSNTKPGTEEISGYTGTLLRRSGDHYVYESEPNEEGSYIFVRMTIDGDLATGTWYENTSPNGEFAGSTYSGAFQALVDKSNSKIEGKWAGIGQEGGKRQIYTGRILFEHLEQQKTDSNS